MVEATIGEVRRQNWKRVGVLGLGEPVVYTEPLTRLGMRCETIDAGTREALDAAIFLVMDGSGQTFDFDNTQVNTATYTYEPTQQELKDSCKKDGYKQYTGENGTPGPFKNQGQCVAYFNH